MKITQYDDLYSMRLGAGETTLISGASGGSNSGFGGDVVGSAGSLSVVGLRQTVSLSSNIAPSAAIGNVLTLISVGGTPVAQFAVASNSGGVSAGSNSTRVSATSAAGVAATYSPSDHRHDGIGTVTASSSNTLDRGTLNLRAGTNVAFALTDSDGSGGLDTVTISSTATGGGAGSSTTGIGWIDSTTNPDKPPGSPNTEDDEFDAGSLDVKWTKTGTGTDTFASSRLTANLPSASANQYTEAYVPGAGVAFTITAKLTGLTLLNNSIGYCGVFAADSGGTFIANSEVRYDSGSTGFKLYKDNPGGSANVLFQSWMNATAAVYIRLARDASNVYTVSASMDGLKYSTFGMVTGTSSTAITKIGFRFGTTAAVTYHYGSIDWFRRT